MKIETSEIEEAFLVNEDPRYEEDKIKKRGMNNSFTYQRKYRTKKNEKGDYAQEIRKPLTSLQYVMLKEQSLDSKFNSVKRERINFVHNNHSFAIDVYNDVNGVDKIYLLRFTSKGQNPKEHIPEFIEFLEDVKQNKKYSLKEIARKV